VIFDHFSSAKFDYVHYLTGSSNLTPLGGVCAQQIDDQTLCRRLTRERERERERD
jgi:hypothetical protein